MMSMNRYKIIQFHSLLAGFLLPIALVVVIGGALYTMDVKGKVAKTEIDWPLAKPFKADLDWLTVQATQALAQKGLQLPDDEPTLKKKKNGKYVARWNTLSYSVTISGRKHDHAALVTVHQRNLLTQLMRIHRAEAGTAFELVTTTLALGLMFILISGIYLAWAIPKLRKPLSISIVTGVVSMVVALLI